MNLSFGDISFRYDPYPIGLARTVLPDRDYADMVEGWPARELFMFIASQVDQGLLARVHPLA
jgi:hypothetical protein